MYQRPNGRRVPRLMTPESIPLSLSTTDNRGNRRRTATATTETTTTAMTTTTTIRPTIRRLTSIGSQNDRLPPSRRQQLQEQQQQEHHHPQHPIQPPRLRPTTSTTRARQPSPPSSIISQPSVADVGSRIERTAPVRRILVMNGGRTDSNENDQVSLMTPNSVPFAPRTISSSSSSETTTVLNINGDMDITAVVGAIWGSGENTYRITPHRTGRRQRRRTITNTSSRHSDDDDSTIIIGCQDVVVAEEVKVEIAEEVTIETLIEELKKHQQRNQQPQHHYEQHIESSSSSSSSDGGGASNKQCVNFKVAGVLLGIAVVIAIVLLIKMTTVTPTGNPIHPAQAPTYMLDSLEDILQSRSNPIITKSVEIAMSNNTSSPQYKAYHWLQRKENTELQGILSSPSPSMNEINEIIRNYTLNVIYYSMKNSSSQLLDNRDWMKCGTGKCNEHEQTVPACVKCGSTDGALDRLFLTGYVHHFNASIPIEIAALTGLEVLVLGSNSLTGTIPTELGLLTKLSRLDLRSNSLTGAIPTELGLLTKLTKLDLGSNSLKGPIPTELGKLTELDDLKLGSNELAGTIPTEVGLLTKLEKLSIQDNKLSGAIATEIRLLTNLQKLLLDNNDIGGVDVNANKIFCDENTQTYNKANYPHLVCVEVDHENVTCDCCNC